VSQENVRVVLAAFDAFDAEVTLTGMETHRSVLATLRDGLTIRAEFYADHHDALRAAGLDE
jgi:lactam utilization protein B